MPQQAFSLGIEYRDPKYWWIGANGNYLAGNYMDVSALLRTENFFEDANGVSLSDVDPALARQLLKQEEFDSFFLFNLQGGKSWKVGNKIIGFFASINNVLDTEYKTGGFEQSRAANYSNLSLDNANGRPQFGPKYFYGFGRTIS